MKKFLLPIFCAIAFNSFSQLIFTSQPNNGVDASLGYHDTYGTDVVNYGTDLYFKAFCQFDPNGYLNMNRSVISFNYATIPSNAIVDSAFVYLFAVSLNSGLSHGGSNASMLQLITNSWNENTVTWASAPSVNSNMQSMIPNSISNYQNYKINVANMVQYHVNNPTLNYGFLFRLQNEDPSIPGKLYFYSSDGAPSGLAPKISIYYHLPCEFITAQPIDVSSTTGNNVQFTVQTNLSNPTITWQSNASNIGWVNLSNNAFYSGVNTNALTVNNLSISNHQQAFRALISDGFCIDTSAVSHIAIRDTCITQVFDTVHVVKDDTLKIDINTQGIPTYTNTFKIYPNPAKDILVIDNGQFQNFNAYKCEIINALSQQVFYAAINQAKFFVDITQWSSPGAYYLRIIDAQNHVIDSRVILVQP
jgi:hypothetical protein